MAFKDFHEAFYFLRDLAIKLRSSGHIEEANFLDYYLQRRDSTTATEAMSKIVCALEEFLLKHSSLLDDIEKRKIKNAMDAYIQGLR